MKDYFIWYVKRAEVEKEKAYNIKFYEIEEYKLRLAVKHGCSFSDVTMIYKKDKDE